MDGVEGFVHQLESDDDQPWHRACRPTPKDQHREDVDTQADMDVESVSAQEQQLVSSVLILFSIETFPAHRWWAERECASRPTLLAGAFTLEPGDHFGDLLSWASIPFREVP